MATLEILKNRASELHSKASSVEGGDDVSQLIADMFETMYKNKGIGLAANQVGVLKRVFVMDVHGVKLGIINPVIEAKNRKWCKSVEGCLSFPRQKRTVSRLKRIRLRGVDHNGDSINIKLIGLAAYCAQHEFDHLEGINIA